MSTPTLNDVINWTHKEDQESHVYQHRIRIVKTLEAVPQGNQNARLLDMGSYLQMAPVCKYNLDYGEVFACFHGKGKRSAMVHGRDGREFRCSLDSFDAEKAEFPYENDFFDCVLCAEVISHLQHDPMWMMYEINRITRMGGTLVLTAPNANSIKACWKALNGFHPGFFPNYIISGDPRLTREYTPAEATKLATTAGFTVEALTGCNYAEPFTDTDTKLIEFMKANWFPELIRDECLILVATKQSVPQERYPKWLYY